MDPEDLFANVVAVLVGGIIIFSIIGWNYSPIIEILPHVIVGTAALAIGIGVYRNVIGNGF